jgi:2'-5' RNA ligase
MLAGVGKSLACFIVSPIEAAAPELAWIEDLRRIHDPHHGVVAAHVTLVFAFTSPAPEEVIRHAREVGGRFAPFDFVLKSTQAVRDATGEGSHVFLVPGPGAAEIVALHDALYGGPLAKQLRPDIPFVPHVTVGHFQSHQDAAAVALELSGAVDVRVSLDRLDVVAFDGGPITVLETVPLSV